jgi:copper transport protein
MLARYAVLLLLLTGVTQSVALVGSFGALVDTQYGLLVLAKVLLLALLIALGAFNQRWALPRMRRLAAGGEAPGTRSDWCHFSNTQVVPISCVT